MAEKVIKLSPSSLNLFLECPHCFWLEKNGIKRPPTYPYLLNSAVDELLKDEFDSYRARNLQHPLLEENKINARLFKSQKLIDRWRDISVGIRYYDKNLRATLFGAIDDVLEFTDKKVAPLDYKSTESSTEKVYDRFQLQLDTYAFLLQKNGYKVKKNGYLAFYIVDKSRGFIDRLPFRKELVEVNTNPSEIYEIFKDAVNVLRLIEPPNHSQDCQFKKWFEGAKEFIK